MVRRGQAIQVMCSVVGTLLFAVIHPIETNLQPVYKLDRVQFQSSGGVGSVGGGDVAVGGKCAQ